EKHHGMTNVLGIFLAVDQRHAGRLAALDLVLQAWPGPVAIEAVLALTHEECLLQQPQALADGPGAWVGAEVAPRLFLRAAMNAQAGKIAAGKKDVGVGFVIAKQDVVRRAPLLDQRLLEQ